MAALPLTPAAAHKVTPYEDALSYFLVQDVLHPPAYKVPPEWYDLSARIMDLVEREHVPDQIWLAMEEQVTRSVHSMRDVWIQYQAKNGREKAVNTILVLQARRVLQQLQAYVKEQSNKNPLCYISRKGKSLFLCFRGLNLLLQLLVEFVGLAFRETDLGLEGGREQGAKFQLERQARKLGLLVRGHGQLELIGVLGQALSREADHGQREMSIVSLVIFGRGGKGDHKIGLIVGQHRKSARDAIRCLGRLGHPVLVVLEFLRIRRRGRRGRCISAALVAVTAHAARIESAVGVAVTRGYRGMESPLLPPATREVILVTLLGRWEEDPYPTSLIFS